MLPRRGAPANVLLAGLGGEDGVIGALAAVGLASTGEDGRYVQVGRSRELRGLQPVAALLEAGVSAVQTRDGRPVAEGLVQTDKLRPARRGGQPVAVVEWARDHWLGDERTADAPLRRLAERAGIVPKMGAPSLVGLTSGIVAAFLGMGDFGALNTFLSYTMVGVGTDLALLLLGRKPENLVIAVVAATIGHFCKFLVKWGMGVATGAPVGLVALGLVKAMVGYVVFGALGGLLGALTLKALRRADFFGYMAEKR